MTDYARYREAVDYLQRRLWHELPIVPIERAMQHRIRQVLAHLGDPHKKFAVVHVGGSAGKGSTATMIASILRAGGARTGLYTSPHLQTFIERIDVDGRLIAPDDFAETVLGLDPLVRRMHLEVIDGVGYGRPALVEVAFAAGLKHFADQQCAAAVIEVGLGGRTDCTNIFDEKRVTVLTNIEFEHTDRLGMTRTSIAREKAALISGRETVVTGETHGDALDVIERRCVETGARLWRLGREIKVRVRDADAHAQTFDVKTPTMRLPGLTIPLAGRHQVRNAALAVAAATAACGALGEDAVRSGLASVRISGRMEMVQEHPRVLLDGAHNPVEARYLAETLKAHFMREGERVHLVCGILADKDQAAMVRWLAGVADSVVVTAPPLVERAGDPDRLLALFRGALGGRNVVFEASPDAALDLALASAAPSDLVCVTGSMYLAGALRERWVPEEQILARRSAIL